VALALAVAGGLLAIWAGAEAWHSVGQTGFTSPERSSRVIVALLTLAVALSAAVALLRAPSPRAEAIAAIGASVLAGTLVTGLIEIGSVADRPDRGAWLAGGAFVLTALGALLLTFGDRVARTRGTLALTVLALVAVAVLAVVIPPGYPPQEPVIR
jgi:hypothetical protein